LGLGFRLGTLLASIVQFSTKLVLDADVTFVSRDGRQMIN